MRQVKVNVIGVDCVTTFTDVATWTGFGPWLLFNDEAEVAAKFERGGVDPEQLRQYRTDWRRWGVGHVRLNLSDVQHANLVAAGIRDPKTAYQKRKARNARCAELRCSRHNR